MAGNGRLVPPPARLNALSPTAPVARPALAWGQVPLRGRLGSKYKNRQYTFGINFLETNVKDPLGYKAPVNPELGYATSLSKLTELFADDDVVDNVGHNAGIVPELFYGQETVKSLRIYQRETDWLTEQSDRSTIATQTNDLLHRYRYVVVGTHSYGHGDNFRRTLERVILRGPYVARHELVPPHGSKLSAAELWRFRSGLLNFAQAKALCIHLSSFRRTTAHGEVLSWSICEGPGPDGDVQLWLQERSTHGTQLHRSADDLAGFGIDGKLGNRIASFKLAFHGRHPGRFSYLPVAPVIEQLYHIECSPENNSLVDGASISVTVDKRKCDVDSKRREAALEYADYAGAFPEVPVRETGLQDEHYYFLSDEEWTGAPINTCWLRPHEHAAKLFTATEVLHVMRRLRHLGFKRIRRVLDLKAYPWFSVPLHNPDIGIRLCAKHSLPELGVTILLEGIFKHRSRKAADQNRE